MSKVAFFCNDSDPTDIRRINAAGTAYVAFAGGGGVSAFSALSDKATADIVGTNTGVAAVAATATAAAAKAATAIQSAIPFSATTGIATKPDATTFSPATGVAPSGGYGTLTCTSNPGTLPTAIDGITSVAINDSLLWSGPLGVWTLQKAAFASTDLSDAASVQKVMTALSAVTYDGSSRATAFTLNGTAYTVAYPSSTSITVTGGGKVKTLTLDGSGRITAVSVA